MVLRLNASLSGLHACVGAPKARNDPGDTLVAPKLKSDYPLVAPAYAARRSDLAKSLGLGHKPKVEAPPPKKRATKTSAKTTASAA